MNAPVLSVVVCTFNRAGLLRECLDSLSEQTLDSALFEVIVVNNNSTDDTQEVIAAFCAKDGRFRAVNECRQGLAAARNRGWLEANGRYVAYIDDDAVAVSEWCERILRAFERPENPPDAVGGRIVPRYRNAPPRWFDDEMESHSWGDQARMLDLPEAPFGFSGSNMAIRRTVLEAHRGFRPDAGMLGARRRVGEDTEFFHRIYPEVNRFWYEPAMTVRHFIPAEHMRISYRFRRSRTVGAANATLEPASRPFPGLRRLARLLLLTGTEPVRFIFVRKGGLSARFVWFLHDFGFFLGRLEAALDGEGKA